MQLFKLENETLCHILNALTDGIYISSLDGETLWLNNASQKILNIPREQLIGKKAYSLEINGVLSPSITNEVIKNRNKVSTVQSYKNGRKILASGHIVYDAEKNPIYILVHTRDITEAVRDSTKLEELEALLRKYSEIIRKMTNEKNTDVQFVGRGKEFDSLNSTLEKVATVHATVLITGETGVGKNVVAQRIHQLSDRHKMPFVQVNCGAIPENLIESELFGYKEGAFTGASKGGKAGLVEAAAGGTLFLDEIGELPLHLQPKLLHLLQNKTYLRIGDSTPRQADVRIIAATNNDLLKLVEEKKFRADLYYRLNVVPIQLKPLRERDEELFPMLYHFLGKFNRQYGKNKEFSPEVLKELDHYPWPGNIRELENLVERLVIISSTDIIQLEDLPAEYRTGPEVLPASGGCLRCPGESLTAFIERIEREQIAQELKQTPSTRKAAKALGISQSLLMRRIRKYGLNKSAFIENG